MDHLLVHLIQHFFKLLLWFDDNLPDSKPLGWKLIFIGLTIASPYFWLRYIPNPNDLAIELAPSWAFLGCACSIVGVYILFRRGVWRWQDRRPERIISMKWK